MNEKFLLTVFICAYNQQGYITQTIESVLAQKTSFDFQIIISDDGSNDGTREIVKSFIDRFPNKIFPVFNEHNVGINETLKKVFPIIDTKYVCMLGGDDYWIDNLKLQKEVDILDGNHNISFVHTGYKQLCDVTNEWGETVQKWSWKDKGKSGEDKLIGVFYNSMTYYPCASTACFRNEPFQRGYLKYSYFLDRGCGEGTILHTSICMSGGDYYFIPDVTTVYRVRDGSLSHPKSINKYLDFRLMYTNLKIFVCKSVGISIERCYCFIENDIDENFIVAYRAKKTDYFKKKVMELDLDKKMRGKYACILSSSFHSLCYYIYIRIKRKISSLFNELNMSA